jgi:hypothetical protein
MKIKTPGFSAEVVLDPTIQNKHYGGLFAGTSDQSAVIPHMSMVEAARFFIDFVIGFIGGAVSGPGGGFNPPAGIGGYVGREVGQEVHCYIRTWKGCYDD